METTEAAAPPQRARNSPVAAASLLAASFLPAPGGQPGEGSPCPDERELEFFRKGSPLSLLSVLERARPDLQGSIIFDAEMRILHISKPLDRVLEFCNTELCNTERAEQTVLGSLAPLLEHGIDAAGGRFRTWIETAMAEPLDEQTLPLHLGFEPGRRLKLDLRPLGELCWVLSLEELSPPRDANKDVFAVLYQDPLTGAANRALFEHKLDVSLQSMNSGMEDSVTVLFVDLDRFKLVNDTLGHAIGDELLGLVAERLRTGLRESDTLARLGGDEFAILLRHGIDQQRITELAQRLIDLLARPYLIDGHVIHIGASIGAAQAPEDGRSRDGLLRSADLALYHSKSAGRGVFHFFAASMEERAQARRALELDLRKALVLRQFELHYQPQIDVESQEVIGLEGLLRWRHPQRGVLFPADFLPLAEEIGLALPIGNWVLKTACKDAASWPNSITVAVNISPVHFESAEFANSAQRALKAASLGGNRLEIEVTEELLLRDAGGVRATLASLRELGVRVAMDSFGTGLTSLSQVVNFPFDKIKIDRSLIGTTTESAKSRAILRAISALGQSLGIATLAEGVETPEHLAHVRAEGCHSVQGFYYSKAVPARELSALLQSLSAKRLQPALRSA